MLILVSYRSRIRTHDQRLRLTLATACEPNQVSSRQDQGRAAATETATASTTAARRTRRRRRTKVPNPAMHTRGSRQDFRLSHPVRRNIQRVDIHRCWLVITRIRAYQRACRIENFDLHRPSRTRLQVVIDHRTEWRILSERFIERHWRAVAAPRGQQKRFRGTEQKPA